MASKKKNAKQTAKTTAIVEVQTPTNPEVEVQTPEIETNTTLPEQPTEELGTATVEMPVEIPTPPTDETIVPTEESQVAIPPASDALAETPTEVLTPPNNEVIVPTEEVPTPAVDEAPKVEEEVEQAAPTTPAKGKKDQGKMSAINAAARVLARKGEPMSCQELIAVMESRGLWTSPGGKTPAATLYAAILREIQAEGSASRFVKVGRGLFTLNPKITEGATKPTKKTAKSEKPKAATSAPTEPTIPAGTEGPESLKSLFRI